MLTPEYLDTLPDAAVALWQRVEEMILREVGRRIALLGELDPLPPAARWQLWRFAQTQALRQDIVRLLARYSGRSDAVIRRLLQEGCSEALRLDDALYRAVGFAPSSADTSPALLNLLNAGYRQTLGSWHNLTATTARTVSSQFEAALDEAWLGVSSGAFGYDAAIRRAVDKLAGQMAGVTYPSGRKDTLEVAVRRCVLTGTGQTAAKLQLARAAEMGCRYVEVSAHSGARSDGSRGPSDHAFWQGKVYHLGGPDEYLGKQYAGFEEATGYGTGEGLCGWNCRHNFHPFWPGISVRNYTDEQLAAMNAPSREYRGKKYTGYELSQKRRALERRVRAAKRRLAAEQGAGLDTRKAAGQLAGAQKALNEFVRETGGKVDAGRTHTAENRASYRGETYQICKPEPEKVPLVSWEGITAEQARNLQQAHKTLLGSLVESEPGLEAGGYLDKDFRLISCVKGGEGKVAAGYQPPNAVGFAHNHPAGECFSPDDVFSFTATPRLRIMTVIGNNGNVYVLEKTGDYNAADLIHLYNNDYPELEAKNIGVDDYVKRMEEFLHEVERYGFIFRAFKL